MCVCLEWGMVFFDYWHFNPLPIRKHTSPLVVTAIAAAENYSMLKKITTYRKPPVFLEEGR